MFTEQDFSIAGIVSAYDLQDITFTHPLQLRKRYLKATGDFSIQQTAEGAILPIHRSEGASIEEKHDTGTNGDTYKVTVSFEVFHPTEDDYEILKMLRRPHHLMLSHMGDHLSVIRATEDGWHYQEEGEDVLKVRITIHNANGQQRILD